MTSPLCPVPREPITVELWFYLEETWSLHTSSLNTYLKGKGWLLHLAMMLQWWTLTKMGKSILGYFIFQRSHCCFDFCRSWEEPSFQVSWFKEYFCCQIFTILSHLHHLYFGSRHSLPLPGCKITFQFSDFNHVLGSWVHENENLGKKINTKNDTYMILFLFLKRLLEHPRCPFESRDWWQSPCMDPWMVMPVWGGDSIFTGSLSALLF